jgi:hypothetical protein
LALSAGSLPLAKVLNRKLLQLKKLSRRFRTKLMRVGVKSSWKFGLRLQLLKDAVKDAPVPPAPMPELERKFAAVQERLSVAVETLLIQTFIGAIEKTTAVMPELNSLVFERVVQFFNADRNEVQNLREKGLTWSSIIVGYGLAKASGKPVKEVFAAHAKEKAWSKVALDLGIKPQALSKSLDGLFPK